MSHNTMVRVIASGPDFLRQLDFNADRIGCPLDVAERVKAALANDGGSGQDIARIANSRIGACLVIAESKVCDADMLEMLFDAARYGLPARGWEHQIISAAFFALGSVLPQLVADHPAHTRVATLIDPYLEWDENHELPSYKAAVWLSCTALRNKSKRAPTKTRRGK